jgi:hypothetical protein
MRGHEAINTARLSAKRPSALSAIAATRSR